MELSDQKPFEKSVGTHAYNGTAHTVSIAAMDISLHRLE